MLWGCFISSRKAAIAQLLLLIAPVTMYSDWWLVRRLFLFAYFQIARALLMRKSWIDVGSSSLSRSAEERQARTQPC
mgnify:CR=1 FL=1